MSREQDHRPHKTPARKMMPDGLEEQSENIGDTSRKDFNLRTDLRDRLEPRAPQATSGDDSLRVETDAPRQSGLTDRSLREQARGAQREAPASVHEAIVRHQEQARQFTEHAAKPAEAQPAGHNDSGVLPPRDAESAPAEAHRQGLYNNDHPLIQEPAEAPGEVRRPLSDAPSRGPDLSGSGKPTAQYKRGAAYQRRFDGLRPDRPDIQLAQQNSGAPLIEPARDTAAPPDPPLSFEQPQEPLSDGSAPARGSPLSHEHAPRSMQERPGRMRYGGKPAAPKDAPRNKYTSPDAAKYIPPDTAKTDGNVATATAEPNPGSAASVPDAAAPDAAVIPPAPATDSGNTQTKKTGADHGSERGKAKKPDRLRFSVGEAATVEDAAPSGKPPPGKKLEKAQHKAERSGGKLDKARQNLPKKRRPAIQRTFDEKSQKPKRKLAFEEEVKSQRAHLKGPLVTRPVKAGANGAIAFGHRKLYQVEHENVGTQAAHKAEMLAESGLRGAYRLHKTAPYRKVERLGSKTTKLNLKASYQQALHDNPKLKSNILSRMAQKRKIQREYAKVAREAQKAGKRAKKTGDVITKAGQAIVRTIARHPIVFGIIGGILLLIVVLTSLFSSGFNMGSGVGGVIVTATYAAHDAEMLAAEAAYAGMEADLQYKLDNYEALNPGYHEYVYDLDSIWHDPYTLISILSAFYDGAWTIGEVQSVLEALFERQYTLTETVTSEVRTRTETVTETDPVTGAETEVECDVEYNYYTVTVTLENKNLSHLPIEIMGEGQLSRYALYTGTLGNRPDLFPVYLYPNASIYKEYGKHDIPQEYLDADPVFAAMITEATKFLGFPYVWGGYCPATSFDCSGFVSWVVNHSGWDVGRLGAQGLYNISTPISAANAKPGDLIFFHHTYEARNPAGATHVGIYVGDGMMLHCGNPIGYVSIETSYWQEHLLGYGRLN